MKHFGLSSKERIKRKKDFQKVYNAGKTVISQDKKFKAVYFFEKTEKNPGVKIAAAVYKKSGNAVWRNRIKRLIKEAYRLNKKILIEISNEKKIILEVIFSPNLLNQKKNKLLYYKDVSPGIIEIMLKIKSAL